MELLRQGFLVVLLVAVLVGLTAAPQRPHDSDASRIDETIDIGPESLDMLSLADISHGKVALQGPVDHSVALADRPAHLSLIYDSAPATVATGSLLSNNGAYLVNSDIPFAIAFISFGGLIIVGFAIMVRESYLRQKE
jgi:hypothetical protein